MNRLIFICVIFSSCVFAQKKIVRGFVFDAETKEVLVGATVFNSSSNIGELTDFRGHFSIQANEKEKIVVSYLGYSSKEIIISKKQELNFFLVPQVQELDEVFILAKKNINDIDLRKSTSAITILTPEKIQNRSSINVMETLQGQIAGLSVKTSGELGKSVKIRIRGTSTLPVKKKGKLTSEQLELLDNRLNQPLYVLDGQIISQTAFEMLNVNDIEQIKVLKDGTANALYGVKAANGVIEVSSKRGKNGRTEYLCFVQQGVTFKGRPVQEMMSTKDKLLFERLSKNEETFGYRYSEEYIRILNRGNENIDKLIKEGKQKIDSIGKINTNWFNELARLSYYRSYNLSIRGGSKSNKFYISGNLSEQGGKFSGNDIRRFNGKLNYEYKLLDKVNVMFNSGFGFSDSNTPNSSDYSPSELMYVLNPYEQQKKGVLISYPNRTFKDLVNQYSKNTDNSSFNFSINTNAKLLKGMYISSVAGFEYGLKESLSIVPPTAYSEIQRAKIEERGKAVKNKFVFTNLTTNTRLSYQKIIAKHDFSLSTNIDFYKNFSDFIGVSGYGLPSKLLSASGINNNIKGGRRSLTSSKTTTDATLGYGFSALYSWNTLFNLYGSYKRDASSLLPKDKRWNSFYALGFSVTLEDNSFVKNINHLQSIGFRSSYGKTASLSGITASLVVPTFGYGSQKYLGLREFYLKDLFNDRLRPEQNTSINLGVDFRLFDNFKLSVDLYHRRTNDMLLTMPIAPSNGFLREMQNVGVMDNRGLEFSLASEFFKTTDFSWNASINLAYNQNKVIDLYESDKLNLSGYPYPDYEQGKSASILYGLRSLGINPADGRPYFLRKDGTRFNGGKDEPKSEDFIVLGDKTPPLNGGFYNSFSYKNLQLSFDMYFSFGGVAKYTNTTRGFSRKDAHKNLPKNKLKQTWFEVGDQGKIYPNMVIGSTEFWTNVSYANTDNTGKTDFIRLNNLMLRYRCDKGYLDNVFGGFFKNASCYMQLKNIGYWSNFDGGDPESKTVQGSAQPIFTTGINLGF